MTTKKKTKRMYKAGDGTLYPLYEAPYPMPVTVYKSDRKRAVIGDPTMCLIALGLRRMKGVVNAWVGSGKDAYVCFAASKLRPAHALHFNVGAQSARVRDYFDTHKDVETQNIQLDPPTAGTTLAAKSKNNKLWRKKVANGEHTPKKRDKPYVRREVRIGVARRPHASIVKNMVVQPAQQQEPAPLPAPLTIRAASTTKE